MERATATRNVASPGELSAAAIRDVDWIAALVGAALCTLYAIAYELSGHPLRELFLGSAFYLFYAVIRRRRPAEALRELSLALTLFGSIRIQWLAGGMLASGVNAVWGLVTLLGVAWVGSRWRTTYWVAGFLIALGIEVAMEILLPIPPPPPRPSWFPLMLAAANCTLAGTFISVFAVRIHSERQAAAEALTAEFQRSESLLLNILPGSIARRLKLAPQSSIAERFEEVSVLFADIVGFSQMSNRVTPAELVDTLDGLFREFDRIAVSRGLEKIKTIGDAYMAVAGAPLARVDHAEVAADAALEMLEIVERDYASKGLAVRIGIESGPVVAGVIGTLKFTYDLWGATVNVASRMESHGTAGAIHVGPGAHERLQSRYRLEAREPVDVKGLGRMKTWYLTGRSQVVAARD